MYVRKRRKREDIPVRQKKGSQRASVCNFKTNLLKSAE